MSIQEEIARVRRVMQPPARGAPEHLLMTQGFSELTAVVTSVCAGIDELLADRDKVRKALQKAEGALMRAAGEWRTDCGETAHIEAAIEAVEAAKKVLASKEAS